MSVNTIDCAQDACLYAAKQFCKDKYPKAHSVTLFTKDEVKAGKAKEYTLLSEEAHVKDGEIEYFYYIGVKGATRIAIL